MTQLDLPPISFARYLDLLKRRRWQVLPVSILGLVIGAVVAFFIPRYYVSETIIEFRGRLLEVSKGEDPMKPLLDSAEISIKYSLASALAHPDISWPEAVSGDANERRAFEEEVRKRIDVIDLGPEDRGRSTALLMIQYKDVNGTRARDLTNTLRDIWRKREAQDLEDRVRAKIADVNARVATQLQLRQNAEKMRENFLVEKKFNPQDLVGDRNGGLSELSRQQSENAKQITDWVVELEGRQREVEKTREQLAQTDAKITEVKAADVPEEISKMLGLLAAQVLLQQAKLSGITKTHKQYATTIEKLARGQAQLAALKEQLGVDQTVEVKNPRYGELFDKAEALDGDIAELEAQLQTAHGLETELAARIEVLPQLMTQYQGFEQQRAEALKQHDLFLDERNGLDARLRLVTQEDAFRVTRYAEVSPRPTEPNITLVALGGSALGLAIAIGLILLMDVAQSTFKTQQDVEHVLPVPVLGGMAHMETFEQRKQVSARRTRTGLVAAAFLLLMVSLITIYYVKPTSLPSAVRDTLELFLGTPGANEQG